MRFISYSYAIVKKTVRSIYFAGAVSAFLFLLLLISTEPSAHAAILEVDRLDDANVFACTAAANDCTLRGAINAAGVGDSITFAPGLSGTITLTSDMDPITGDLTIIGPGQSVLTISGNSLWQIFYVASDAVTLTISDLTIANGKTSGDGGAVYNGNFGAVIIARCTFADNVAGESGGAIHAHNSNVQVSNSTFLRNRSLSNLPNRGGGGIFVASVNKTVARNVTVSNSVFDSNDGFSGGAIGSVSDEGWTVLNISNSTFSNNQSRDGSGGAIGLPKGTLVISGSTFNNNRSLGSDGGAIQLLSGVGISTITNSTFIGNKSAGTGGGIYMGDGLLDLNYVTVVENNADSDNNSFGSGGGIAFLPSGTGTLTVGNSIIANNTAAAGSGNDCYSLSLFPITSSDYNLIRDTLNCIIVGSVANNISGVSPNYGLLNNYGGFTSTVPLVSGSPAIDAANPLSCVATDQRGIIRPQGVRCDIGAFEYVPPVNYTVTAIAAGNGTGNVVSDIGGINYNYPGTTTQTTSAIISGTTVTLTATAAAGSTVAWTACTGGTPGGTATVATCAYSPLSGNVASGGAVATFILNQYTVTANANGTGSGTVASNTGGINYSYPAINTGTTSLINDGTLVILTAAASPGSTVAWTICTGAVSGNGTGTATCTCSSLDATKTATATFTGPPIGVPTMNEWGIIIFITFAGLLSVYTLRSQAAGR